MKKYVVAFDVCSSSVLIEDLVRHERVPDYGKLIDAFFAYINTKRDQYHIELYKFVGDGLILFLDETVSMDDVLSFCIELTTFSKQILLWFKEEYLTLAKLPREGITIGLSLGSIHCVRTINMAHTEYFGRAINVACRLQSLLDKKRHANKFLMEAPLYKLIDGYLFKKACRRTTRSLRNLNENAEERCYEFNPEIFVDFDWQLLQSPTEKAKQMLSNELFRRLYRQQQRQIERLIEEYLHEKEEDESE